jgi:hypothetical protein
VVYCGWGIPLTGGAYGPEAGLVGMAFRFVVTALLLYYLHLCCGRQGNIRTRDFPIKIYDNPVRRKPAMQQGT